PPRPPRAPREPGPPLRPPREEGARRLRGRGRPRGEAGGPHRGPPPGPAAGRYQGPRLRRVGNRVRGGGGHDPRGRPRGADPRRLLVLRRPPHHRRARVRTGEGLLMYGEYYGLAEKAFVKTPDPRFLFLNEVYEEALERLLYAV